MAGWSNLTQLQLRTLLRSHGQPTDGGKAALVQRLAAFLSHDREATGDGDVGEGDGPSASETAELEAVELQVIRTETVAATARGVLHQHRVRHNEQICALLQLVAHDDLRPTFMRAEVWGVVWLWRLRGWPWRRRRPRSSSSKAQAQAQAQAQAGQGQTTRWRR